ncbi:MAG: hypothetical protein DWP92_05300 [Armatimonadetes bacterium]|nr:MAG: hypothetical protein DWP92_05300 [Armatimonadota bacterium]
MMTGVEILTGDVDDLIEVEPTPEQLVERYSTVQPPATSTPDDLLPVTLSGDQLGEWGMDLGSTL